MNRKLQRKRAGLCICLLTLLLAAWLLPVTAYAADQNLPDVQFTTGKYGKNCLTASNWSKSEKTLNLTQNVYLDAAAQQRANQGELKITASVKVGANGSRTNTRKLEVKFFDKSGNQVGSTQRSESSSYSVKHHWNTLTVADRSVPKNTYRIQYYVYNHIGTKGDLEIENCSLTISDTVYPKLVNITAATNDGREWNQPHPAGTQVTYTLHFSERVTAQVNLAADKGAPWIEPYSPGVTAGRVTATGDGAASTLSYTYTIPSAGDVISDNHIIALRGISAFTATDDAGNTSTVGLTENDVKKLNSNLASGGTLRMDNRPPELTGITSEGFSKDTVLEAGDTIKLHLKFHENITVPGSAPSITFSNGRTATYIPTGTTTNLASFSYTVGAGDDINALAIERFDLSGIVDGVNQDCTASSRYAAFTAAHKDYLAPYGVDIDTMAPVATLPEFTEDWLGRESAVTVTVSDNGKPNVTGSGVRLTQYAWTQSGEAVPERFFDLLESETGSYSIDAPSGTGSWYLWVRSQDRAGNRSEPVCSSAPARFDLTAPEITLSKTVEGDLVLGVSAAFSDSESGIALREYRWFDAEGTLVELGTLQEEQQPPYPGQSGIYRLQLRAVDAVGNTGTCEQEVSVDSTPPTVTISGAGEGYQQSHTLQAQCTDDMTGVKRVEFQWKPEAAAAADGDWQTADSLSFPSPEHENGQWRLYVRATDAAGNQTVEYAACLLDNTAPTVTMTPDGNAGDVGKESYTVTVVAEDTVSIRNRLSVCYALSDSAELTGAESWVSVDDPTEISVRIEPQTDTYLHVKAQDEAGNVRIVSSQVFAADRTAPTGTIALDPSWQQITNISSGSVLLTATDDHAEAADMQMLVSVDAEESGWAAFSPSVEVSFAQTEGPHTISVCFRDPAGNVSDPVSVTVVYDITPPVITLTYSQTERTNEDVRVTAALSDGVWITEDSFTFSANGTFTFRARDAAGNISSQTAAVTWIDKAPPELTLTSPEADSAPHKTASFTAESADADLAALFWRICPSGDSEGAWQRMTGSTQSLPQLPDGSYRVEAYAEDDLGNRSELRSLTILLDNTPPRASLAYLPTGRTSENVTATLFLEDASAVTVTQPQDGSYTHVFTNNGSFTFCFTDAAGNSGTLEACVDWIDRTLPALETEITGADGEALASGQWTNQPVKVALKLTHAAQKYDLLTFNGQDVLGEKIQSADGIQPIPNESDTYLVSTYGVLEYQITDTQTNLTSHGSILLAVDTTAPACADGDVQFSATNWTNQAVTVRIQARDDLAKTVTYLRLDGDVYVADTSADTHVFTQNGTHTFYFRDEAGNVGSKTVTVGWIDTEVPTAIVHYTTADGKVYDPADWTNQSVTAALEFVSASPVTMLEGADSHVFSANGSHVFEYVDAAGNRSSTTVTIDKIDKVAPTGYFTASISGWTNEDVTVTLHAADDASGAEDMTHLFTQNETHTFVLRDRAGNEAQYPYVMDRIDKQPPEITLTYTPGNLTKTPFAVYVNAKADERVFWDNGISSRRFAENGEYVFAATDRAGNRTEITAAVDWISPDLPEVELSYSTTEATNEDVTVELRTTDAHASIRVLNNGGSRFYTFRQNGSFTFRYTDMAGKNTGTITATVTCIDKTGPQLTAQADRTELGAGPVTVTVTADEPVVWPNGMTVIDPQTATVAFTENIAAQLWAEDALGNRGFTQLTVDCIDSTAPVICMEQAFVCLELGQAFDPMEGITVEDENPAADPLRITGSVDNQTPGQYTLTYTAVDAAGNQSTAQRVVAVFDPNEFQIRINNQLYLGQTIVVSPKDNIVELIHAEGAVSVKLLPGRESFGNFKTGGTQIADALLSGSYQFPGSGYVTLLVQDQERNTKLIELFVVHIG